MIMIENERITENVRSWWTDVISAVTSALPADKIILCVFDSIGFCRDSYDVALCRFEAADPFVFTYHVQNQGARANLLIDQIVQLACLRRGSWGTGSTFGKVVTFEGTWERGAILDDFHPLVSDPKQRFMYFVANVYNTIWNWTEAVLVCSKIFNNGYQTLTKGSIYILERIQSTSFFPL